MSYYQEYLKVKDIDFQAFFQQINEDDVERVLNKDSLNKEDYLTLLSPTAGDYLEEMAQKAHQLTVQQFGRVVFLYAPLYLADYCANRCAYCGFNVDNDFDRTKLTLEEVRREAKAISAKGIKHILILTGDSRKETPVSYIRDCVTVLKDHFTSIAIEVYALTEDEYHQLFEAGVDGLTIYQEVYDEEIYDQVHLKGPKKDYQFRLEAPERGCKAGMRRVNIGALLGLDDWRKEAFITGLHAKYLQNNYLETEISMSIPRLRPHLGSFQPSSVVEDKDLAQIILASRLFLPRVGINLSTRESSQLRENLLPLGITKMSAEACTVVGGYSVNQGTAQFDISDDRTVDQIRQMLVEKGYQPVFKDWHRI